jgi:putative phosphoesterase
MSHTAIISDVHGNFHALSAVLADIARCGCEKIVSLGDIAGYGCQVNECIAELRSRNIVNILGNHDHYLISGEGCPRSNSANKCIEYQRKVISPAHFEWLSRSLLEVRSGDRWFVHGGWQDPVDEYMLEISPEYFDSFNGTLFVSGHTHVQTLAPLGKKTYCNPGSVGQPRDGDWRAAYAILDGTNVELRRVEYDVEAMCREMSSCGFSEHFYENLRNGTRIGGERSVVRILRDGQVT